MDIPKKKFNLFVSIHITSMSESIMKHESPILTTKISLILISLWFLAGRKQKVGRKFWCQFCFHPIKCWYGFFLFDYVFISFLLKKKLTEFFTTVYQVFIESNILNLILLTNNLFYWTIKIKLLNGWYKLINSYWVIFEYTFVVELQC